MKLWTSLLAISLLLSACNTEIFSNAKKEALEAAENLNNEANEVINDVETKVNQVKDAADSVQQASESIKDLTGSE